ncbi:MAG TPA: hypothetical protein VGM84_26735, partial [Steroidobacteraceae bacterium]
MALVDNQVIVLVPPLDTLVGLAVIATVGAGGGVTVTVADGAVVPPAFVQLSVKAVVDVSGPVETDPEAGLLLPANVPPLPVQVVALVHDQVSVLLPPLGTVDGDALIETVGGLTTVTVVDCIAVPPVPVQLNAKVVLEVSGPVETDPEAGLLFPANVPPLP